MRRIAAAEIFFEMMNWEGRFADIFRWICPEASVFVVLARLNAEADVRNSSQRIMRTETAMKLRESLTDYSQNNPSLNEVVLDSGLDDLYALYLIVDTHGFAVTGLRTTFT